MNPIAKRIYEKVLAGEPLSGVLRARLLGMIATSDDWMDQLTAANDQRDVARYEAGKALELLAESVAINDQCRKLIGQLRGELTAFKTERGQRTGGKGWGE